MGGDSTIVFDTLRHLWIEELGLEPQLRARAVAHLRDVFQNPDQLVTELHNWFLQYPDGTIPVTVPLLYEQVIQRRGVRDPSRPRWIHLARDGAKLTWKVNGPLALDEVVQHAWGISESVRLQLGSPPYRGESACNSLSRLILHQTPRASTETEHSGEWQVHHQTVCGGTLGGSSEGLTAACGPLSFRPPDFPGVEFSDQDLSRRLSDEMNDRVWREYLESVGKHLVEDNIGTDLRAAMQTLWLSWSAQLTADSVLRVSFMRSMLATVEESRRPGFDTAVRLGRTVVDALARTTVIVLGIAAALAAGNLPISIQAGAAPGSLTLLAFGSVTAHPVALVAASHPDERRPWHLSNAPGPMFALETGLAILGLINASPDELYRVAVSGNVPFHASDAATQSYRHSGRPAPMLTASPLLNQAMQTGLEAIRQHLRDVLRKVDDDRLASLQQAVERGAPNGG